MTANIKSKLDIKKIIISLPIIVAMLSIVINPKRYIESALEGLIIFAHNVLPALFPFFFFTKLLTSIGMAESISRLFEKSNRLLYNTSSVGGYVFVMSVLSGYPVGAKLIADLYESGQISKDDAKSIMTYTSLSGPLFVIGTVGTIFLKNTFYGYIILTANILGAILNGLLYRKKNNGKIEQNMGFSPLNIDNMLEKTINSSISSILMVGGYIVIFYMLGDVFVDIGLIDIVARCLDIPLSIVGVDESITKGIALSMVEMTRGVMSIATSPNNIAKVTVISGVIALGGLSITIQSITFLKKAKIKVSLYIKSKLTQSFITSIITLIIMLIV